MRILVADDDRASRLLLERKLASWGHAAESVADGAAAWAALEGGDPPPLAILDWEMPGLDGVEICRRARAREGAKPLYVVLLTGRSAPEDLTLALDSGADDYVRKPFDAAELRARVNVGVRVMRLQCELAERVGELEDALARVDELHGILPICAYCKKVRDDANSWQQIEAYVSAHSAARFSHGICPACAADVFGRSGG